MTTDCGPVNAASVACLFQIKADVSAKGYAHKSKAYVKDYAHLMLIYDEPLLSSQPPLGGNEGQYPEGGSLIEVQL